MKREELMKQIKELGIEDIQHVFDEHLDKEDGYLIDRIISERKKIATTFSPKFGEKEILNMIKFCLLKDNTLEYLEKLSVECRKYGVTDARPLVFNSSTVIGSGYFREKWHNWNDDGAVSCSQLRVFIYFDVNGYLNIKSAYPSVNNRDMAALMKKQQANKKKRA